MATQPLKIAVLVSGNGSNLQVLIDKMHAGTLPIEIVGVISNKANAYALTRAQTAHVATAVIDKDANGKRYSRQGFEQKALDTLTEWQPDLIVLAGFMRILTPLFIDGVTDGLQIPMINLHPSLLPNYKGLDTHSRVLQSGETFHGCSVHLVNSELDAGAVIAQAVTQVRPHETADVLQHRVHQMEYQLLPMVVGLFAQQVITVQQGVLTNQLGITLPLKLLL